MPGKGWLVPQTDGWLTSRTIQTISVRCCLWPRKKTPSVSVLLLLISVRVAVQHCQAAFCSGQSQTLCRDDENLSDRMSVRKISSALLPQSCIFKMTNINIFIYCTFRKAGDLWPACVWCKVTRRGGWKGCHLLDFSRHDVFYRLGWTEDHMLLLKKNW